MNYKENRGDVSLGFMWVFWSRGVSYAHDKNSEDRHKFLGAYDIENDYYIWDEFIESKFGFLINFEI